MRTSCSSRWAAALAATAAHPRGVERHPFLRFPQVMLNPFYTPDARIESREFDARVKALVKRHLGYRVDA